jgi:hypothetical protein
VPGWLAVSAPKYRSRRARHLVSQKYRLNPFRIGDLWITAAKDVVFGHSTDEREKLAGDYRSHGSAHELDIPGFIYRYADALPPADAIATNVDLCKFLYQGRMPV